MKHTYLVCLDVSDNLPKEVVDNYVNRALKRYQENDPQDAFSQARLHVAVSMAIPVDYDQDKAIEETISLVKNIRGYFKVLERFKKD